MILLNATLYINKLNNLLTTKGSQSSHTQNTIALAAK